MYVTQARHAGQDVGIERVSVKALIDLPVHTRNISEKMTKMSSDMAQQNPALIRPVSVGKVGSELYVINDFETIIGLRSAGILETNALVSEYSTVGEVVIEHVHRNFQPHSIDPLKLHEVVQYLIQSGIRGSEINRILWIDQRPELANTLRCSITDEARQVLVDMMDNVSKKVHNAVLPPYYITKISKIADSKQHTAALELRSLTLAKTVSEASFSWLTSDTVSTTLGNMEKKKDKPAAEDRIARRDGDPPPDKKTVKKAEKYIGDDPSLIFVPMEGKGPDLILNKKTGRISETKNTSGTYSLVGDRGRSVFVIPRKAVEFLDAENEDVLFYKYATLEKAAGALGRAKAGGSRCVIITSATLCRR